MSRTAGAAAAFGGVKSAAAPSKSAAPAPSFSKNAASSSSSSAPQQAAAVTATSAAMSGVKNTKQLLQLDENQLVEKMKTLGSVTRGDKRAARKVARNKDTIHSLLETMNSKPKFGKMVEYSIECLKNMAVDEVSIEEMIEEGVLETLMTVMKLNPYNERIQHMVNLTIQAFAINERMAALIAQKLGAGPFVFSMKKHVEPETLSSTCAATAKLMMKCEDNVNLMVMGGVIPALKNVMKQGEQHGDVLAQALSCLSKIADNPGYAPEIMASGVIQDVLDALRHFPENAAVVENGVALLGKLAAASPEILEQLKKMGAVDVIVQALEHHPDNTKLIELGANALKYLSNAGDVMGALAVTQGNTEATALALAKIASLMLVDDNVDYMVSHEGIQWLIQALQSAIGDHSETASKILAAGCRALMRMAIDENKIYGIMQQGGVKLLISIIDNHIDDENVVCAALQALAKMVTRKENAIYIIKSGGLRAAHAAIQAHPKSEKVAKCVEDLFMRIAAHEDCVPMLLDNKVVEAVGDILKNHPKNADIAMGAINTLGRMAISAENVRAIAKAGGLSQMISILNALKEDLGVAKQDLLLVETTALLPENIEPLRSLGAMDSILAAMDSHPEDAELQQIGSRTLALIAGEQQLKQAVQHVGQLADQMSKSTPAQAAQYIDKLLNAVRLVGNLALIDQNIPALIKSGAIQTLMSAFNAAAKLPPSEKRSQLLTAASAGLLRLFTKDPSQTVQFVKDGGLKQLLGVALKEPENEQLAENVAELAVLCAQNPKNHAKMIADGTIQDLIALAKQHHLNENVLAAVTKAIGLLATTDDLARQAVKAGAADIIVESMYANLENKERLMNALQVMNQLCVDDACCEAFLKAGAIDALLEAFRAHAHNPDVLTLCCHCFCRLLINEQVAEEVGTKGGIPLFVKAMREHYTVEPLCEIDMILMDSLASVPTNTGRLNEHELATVELITWIGEHYSKNVPLNEAKERLLAALQGPAKKKKEELVLTDESFDEAKCDVMVSKFRNAKLDKQEALNMLQNLVHNLQDGRNAEMMIARGGLQALAALMNNFKDDEQLFYTAANAFLTLADMGGDHVLEMLEEPSLMNALCSCINAHELFDTPMDLNDLTKAVAAGAKMKLKPATVTEMLKNKPLNSLMKIMVQSDDPLLLAQAARLLGKLSNNNDAALLLSKIANLRELIQALRRNMKNEEFLKYGVYLLANLAVNDDLKSQIGIEGGIQVILQIMDTYPNNAGLIENCVYALANLTYANEVNCSFVVACKGIPLLVGVMHTHNKATELLESAVCVLCNLCHKNDNNKDAIIRNNGAQSIVDTVLNNFNAIELLLTCFRTIGNLAYNVHSTTSIIQAGGVQGVVAGMTVHGDNEEIIDMSIKVLTNLSTDSTPENMLIMANEGAVQAVVEVAAQYTDKLDIELAALTCLCHLARHHDNASMIIKQGGADACIRTMQALDFDGNLIAAAVRLIAILSHALPVDLDRMMENGIAESLVTAIKAHANNRVVLSNGLLALTLLAYNTDSANKLAQKGVIQLCLRIVSDHLNEPAILVECFPALSALSRSESNAVSMSELALKSLVTSITSNMSDAAFLPYAFTFLSNLCVHSAAAEAVLGVPICKTTLTTLAQHSMSPEVMLRGLRSLENMAFSTNEVKQHMKNVGVETTVTDWMTVHASHDDIRAACKAVLDALNRIDWNYQAADLKQIKMADIEKKSAKKIFGDEEKPPEEVTELPVWVKNLLTAGALLTKHSNTAAPRPRHVYVTSDLKFLIWKDPKEKELHPDNKMKVFRIRTVDKGRATPQLQRKQWGKFLAKEECAFSIIGRDRTVDLECATEADRNKWCEAIELLVAYRKALKKANTQFGNALRGDD